MSPSDSAKEETNSRLAVRTFDLCGKSLMRTAGPGAVCKAGKGWSPFTLPSILYDHSWDNTSPARYKRIPPANSFVRSQIIFGRGNSDTERTG